MQQQTLEPIHLCLLIHGFGGNPGELAYIRQQLLASASNTTPQNGTKLKVVIPSCNFNKTNDGILEGASRIFQLLVKIVRNSTTFKAEGLEDDGEDEESNSKEDDELERDNISGGSDYVVVKKKTPPSVGNSSANATAADMTVQNLSSSQDDVKAGKKPQYKVVKLSLIGHSLGGIYARTLVGLIGRDALFDDIDLVNFITLATPHLGARQHVWVNEATTHFIGKHFIGKTLLELTLTDEPAGTKAATSDKGNTFMLSLLHPDFLTPLRERFHLCMALANIREDLTVNYSTSSIRLTGFRHGSARDGIVPISRLDLTPIIFFEDPSSPAVDESSETVTVISSNSSSTTNPILLTTAYESQMFKALDTIPWKRVAVHTGRPCLGHTDIIVQKAPRDVKWGGRAVQTLVEAFIF